MKEEGQEGHTHAGPLTLVYAHSSSESLRLKAPRERVRDRVRFGGGRKWSTENCLRECGFPLSSVSSPFSRADCVVAMIRSAPSDVWSANIDYRKKKRREGII